MRCPNESICPKMEAIFRKLQQIQRALKKKLDKEAMKEAHPCINPFSEFSRSDNLFSLKTHRVVGSAQEETNEPDYSLLEYLSISQDGDLETSVGTFAG